MCARFVPFAAAAAIAVSGALVARLSAGGQAPARGAGGAAAGKSALPRTPDGHPDLQGTYDVATITPVERPTALGNRRVLTDAEVAEAEQGVLARVALGDRPVEPNRSAPPIGGDGSPGAAGRVGGYNSFWIDGGKLVVRVGGEPRSSLVIDPPNGRVPPQTPEARQRNAARLASFVRPTSDAAENDNGEGPNAYDDPERRPLAERCILGFGSTSGPPTLPNYFYNNLKQIVQTGDHVMILVEMIHDARIVRMNQPHLPPTVRKWMGDSVGRWEGDTLVIDTTNFTDQTRFRGATENLHIVERITRQDANTLIYRFTVEDPATWTRPWTGEYNWRATNEQMYEYACHEANYALGNILRGYRAIEARQRSKK
jgi:hypothetical protein